MVTLRDNLLRTLRRQGFEKVPLDPSSFCPDQLEAFKKRFGHDQYHHWFGSPFGAFGIRGEQPFTDWKRYYRHEELPPDTTFSGTGVGNSHQPGCFHMTRMHHPLKGDDLTVAELKEYPLPHYPAVVVAETKKKVDDLRQQGLASAAEMACTIWEGAWYMRSMEDLMVDLLNDDDRATVLLDRMTEMACVKIRIAAQAGRGRGPGHGWGGLG